MAKLATNGMIDGGLVKVQSCVKMTVCAGQPISFADIAVKALSSVVMTPTTDFPISNGTTNGRKVTVASKSAVSITATGTADHVVIDDGVSEYEVTTATAQALTSGGTVTVPAWNIEVSDPF